MDVRFGSALPRHAVSRLRLISKDGVRARPSINELSAVPRKMKTSSAQKTPPLRESDVRPKDVFAEYLRLSAADADTFFPDKSLLVPRPCPGCGSDDPRPAFRKHGFQLATCVGCGTLYVNPAPTGAQIDAFYRDSPSTRYWATVFFPKVAEIRRTRIFRPRVSRILSLCERLGGAPRRIIDVGTGAAIFLQEFRALSPTAEIRAVEPGQELAAACKENGIETFEGFAEVAARTEGWADWADLVTSFEVIEHVPAADAFFQALSGLARPGGLIVVTGLSCDGFDIQMLGPKSNAVSPPHHLNFLSRRGVAALLDRCGLEEVDFFTPGQLDVDIVCNALEEDSEAVTDPNLRDYLLTATPAARARFQEELAKTGRSSHMWILARRPEAC